ncbi:hypothetical protein S7711_07558 [Stachybotrys chartarum IBT 7711]|uniref:Metallo-beta-lactamase domain-containing protein n=1 Tax=Stachybotrys chartarum (strain CBS 109288 / IBT 7711) TaxID=1280523 RepID=A0A084AN98_STACB|nr:hypothetical protein S7711_07558 [Stachybotrys chartarum IBT 7711]
MSTFDGLVAEFPDIRSAPSPSPARSRCPRHVASVPNRAIVDYFRQHAGTSPPLACFLSHIHSDHLAGLESLRSPFVYCSAATREMLLRLERYPCRINYAKGILEARQQTYKHLHKVLKPLPLGTPTRIELRPDHDIQVTLLDANHCPGAVMILIESQASVVLYTGDIRSEPWFVNSLARNPSIIEYTSGIRTLDKIYLDTSYVEDVPFQAKSEGLAELIRTVKEYPPDTVFHLQAWTYGYEDVWVALAKALNSAIHVDDYKLRVYGSLRSRPSHDQYGPDWHLAPEAPALMGFMRGNEAHPGCLTSDEEVRLHSCEKGNMCSAASQPSVVKIQPIIARLPNGQDIAEAGVGGGGDDLEREVELDVLSRDDLDTLLDLIISAGDMSQAKQRVMQAAFAQCATSGRPLALNLDASSLGDDLSTSLRDAIKAIARCPGPNPAPNDSTAGHVEGPSKILPRIIQFPYSRHSSYAELCLLVDLFKPRDVWPCTVNIEEWLQNGTPGRLPLKTDQLLTNICKDLSIRTLFGPYCSGDSFAHDLRLNALAGILRREDEPSQARETQLTCSNLDADPSSSPPLLQPAMPCDSAVPPAPSTNPRAADGQIGDLPAGAASARYPTRRGCVMADSEVQKRNFDEFRHGHDTQGADGDDDSSQQTQASATSTPARYSAARVDAYNQMRRNYLDGDHWAPIQLLSTGDNHTEPDTEL